MAKTRIEISQSNVGLQELSVLNAEALARSSTLWLAKREWTEQEVGVVGQTSHSPFVYHFVQSKQKNLMLLIDITYCIFPTFC